jgi:hypothetical protein
MGEAALGIEDVALEGSTHLSHVDSSCRTLNANGAPIKKSFFPFREPDRVLSHEHAHTTNTCRVQAGGLVLTHCRHH